MQRLIAAGGKAGAGKDHVLNLLCRYEAGQTGSVIISGFGDLVRAELPADSTRRDWQVHGQLRRQEDENYWVKRANEWGHDMVDAGYEAIGFSGIRFLNEVDGLQRGGFWVGLVEAPQMDREERLFLRDGRAWTQEELNDATETSLDLIHRETWDWIWRND